MTIINVVTPKASAKHDLLFNKPASVCLMLGSSFRCDQIHKCQIYDFGHTLLCFLCLTMMFNKPTSSFLSIGLLNKFLRLVIPSLSKATSVSALFRLVCATFKLDLSRTTKCDLIHNND